MIRTQGRKSSSHLFSFYVSDRASDNVNINDYMDPYNIAQLADDTTIISETFESLRSKMKAIVSYSEKRYQIPNVKKHITVTLVITSLIILCSWMTII